MLSEKAGIFVNCHDKIVILSKIFKALVCNNLHAHKYIILGNLLSNFWVPFLSSPGIAWIGLLLNNLPLHEGLKTGAFVLRDSPRFLFHHFLYKFISAILPSGNWPLLRNQNTYKFNFPCGCSSIGQPQMEKELTLCFDNGKNEGHLLLGVKEEVRSKNLKQWKKIIIIL